MKLFRILFGWLANRWVFSVLGLTLLALLIWFVGPLIAIGGWEPLADREARLLAILVVVVLWAVKTIWSILRGAQNNAQVVKALASAPADDDKASTEEVELLQRRFREALTLLKKAKLGGRGRRRRLYQLPWYLMIGPPGAGKTTALKNSGLNFPLADRFGKDAVRGVGGTRNCDWWFTDEAVLLDTAGRYTTQDSDQTVDSAAWGGFLQLLRKHRRRRPIDGVLVAISLTDLVTDSMEKRQHHALAVRKRLQELQEELKVRVPVYVVFTKCDLMSGFIEFFDDLGRDERGQVWGATFPIAVSEKPEEVIEAFGPQLDALLERLDSRLPGRLNQERDLHRRGMMLGFVQQMASLKAPLQQFMNDAFYPSRYEDSSLIRGVYFSSGTQEGTPIDRILSSVSATFGLDSQAMPSFSGPGRSYFLTRLLRDVVFQEADLVGDRSFLAQYGNWITRGVHAVSAVALLALVGVWLLSYSQNESYIADVSDKLSQYKQVTENLDNDSLLDVLPPLDMLGDVPGVYKDRSAFTRLTMGFGLYQGNKLGQAATAAYRRALNAAMLPRMLNRVHIRTRQSVDQTEALYQALKVYLMLGYPEHLDRGLAKDWFTVDWALRFPGPTNEEVRDRLQTHLAALLDGELTPPALDASLVASARRILAQRPLAERVYAEVKREAEQAKLEEWRPTDKVKDVARYFRRKSGAPMTAGMRGLFTFKGYNSEFLVRVPEFAKNAAGETWVIGSANKDSLDNADVTAVTNAVLELYYDDYIRQWQAYLADVDIVPFRSIAEATEVSKVLSGADSPIKGFLAAVSEETRLARLPGDIGADGGGLLGDWIEKFREAGVEDPAYKVNRRFADLRQVIVPPNDGAAPRIDRSLALVNELYAHLVATRDLDAPPPVDGVGIHVRLKQEAGRLPSPLSNWLRSLSRQSSRVAAGTARQRLDDIWASDIAPFCRTALSNRYPLARGSREDANLGDFAQYFGPNGLVDKFVKSELKPFVDTSVRPWREIDRGGVQIGLAEGSLRAIEGAAKIKDAFFSGGAEPSARFAVKPLELDRNARQVQLELGGQRLTYRHGPTRLANMQWPPPDGSMMARLVFTPIGGSTAGTSLSAEGPWALYRLLDKGRLRRVSNSIDRFRVTFQVDGLTAIFELKAASVDNPFWLSGMTGLRCLGKL